MVAGKTRRERSHRNGPLSGTVLAAPEWADLDRPKPQGLFLPCVNEMHLFRFLPHVREDRFGLEHPSKPDC